MQERYRADYGDISILANSIESIGLLHPVVVNNDKQLICGGRRVKAFQHLGINKIPARIIDIDSILVGEYAENEVRKDFTQSERVAIARAIESELGERRGRPSEKNTQNFAELNSDKGKETAEIAAKKSGFGNKETYRQAKKVTESGTSELVTAMDEGRVKPSVAEKLTSLPPAEQILLASKGKEKEAKQTAKEITQAKRCEKEKKREIARYQNKQKVALLDKSTPLEKMGAVFSTIVIDPPWDWGDEGDKDQLGRARPDYHTLSFNELLNLPVGDISLPDAHIYLWITNRSLPKGFALLERWGFRYITAITWVKPSFGMGNYFRGQTEHVLFGVKGSLPLKRKDVGTVFNAARGKGGHSSKPSELYNLVESCSYGPFLDMFSRTEHEGWTTWGENSNATP